MSSLTLRIIQVLFSEINSPPVHLKVVLIYFIQDFLFLLYFFSWLNGKNCCRQERCISMMCTYWKNWCLIIKILFWSNISVFIYFNVIQREKVLQWKLRCLFVVTTQIILDKLTSQVSVGMVSQLGGIFFVCWFSVCIRDFQFILNEI